MIFLHLVLCGIILWSAWCRIVKMSDHKTRIEIRLSFVFSAIAAMTLLIAPFGSQLWDWFPVYHPHWAELMMLLAFAAVQLSTAKYWAKGTPSQYNKEQ